ncbi:hypothetical protein L7F22_006544 [Adiantum nelumboides]|nr:hypothetical protein [Adiantum nelumboides]
MRKFEAGLHDGLQKAMKLYPRRTLPTLIESARIADSIHQKGTPRKFEQSNYHAKQKSLGFQPKSKNISKKPNQPNQTKKGGVASMDSFLLYFFPAVYVQKQKASESNYCKFSDPFLQAFTSSMYIAGLLATFAASQTTQKLGRKPTIIVTGCLYLVDVCLVTLAKNVTMLMLGRVVLGCGSGFGNQAAPIYLSEVAPPKLRGGLNIMFQLNVTVGILIANLINSLTANLDWGWRLAFGVGLIPAVLSLVGSLFLLETPNSLIERGHFEQGKRVLMKLRDTSNVDEEFKSLVKASEMAARVKDPFRKMLRRRNLPPLIIGILIQVFQQLSGINAIMFYAPVLLETMGFKNNAALYSAAITGTVNVIATVVTLFVVDHFGRVPLLLAGGAQMFISQAVIGVVLGVDLKDSGGLPLTESIVVVVMVCFFVIAFAYSWGCMGMLIPSETFSLEVRSAGQSIVVCVNLLFTFLMAQVFLSLLCAMKYGVFLLFALVVFVMSAFVYLFVPETKGIRIDEAHQLWKAHWFWKKIVGEDVEHNEEAATPLLVSVS